MALNIMLRGIGLITGQFWMIDHRVYDPDGAGKSKLDHLLDTPSQVLHYKGLAFRAVGMQFRFELAYAPQKVMAAIDQAGKI